MPRTVNLTLSLPHSPFLRDYNATQQEPDFRINFTFNFKHETLQRDEHGRVTVIDCYPLGPSSFSYFEVSAHFLATPSLCRLHLYNFLSSLHHLDVHLRLYLIRNIAPFLTDAASCQLPLLGFYAIADLEVIIHEWVSDAPEIIPTTEYSRGVGGGLSRSAIEKLKERHATSSGGDGDGFAGECAICLEDYSEVVKVMKMPCSHVFHENCIFKWLVKRNSCPLCRLQVEI